MILDGRAIAARILGETAARAARLAAPPTFLGIAVTPTPAIESYLRMKARAAERAGVRMEIRALPDATDASLAAAIRDAQADAVIVQLPLPPRLDRDAALAAIPVERDADALSPAARAAALVPHPVAAAMAEALAAAGVDPAGKRAAVVGHGWLVGQPVAAWLAAAGAAVTVVTEESGDLAAALADADIVATGAGAPGLIRPELVRPGAAVLDAGTGELGGQVAGDADPAVAEVAGLFTPVPGGIGPVAVACLMRNVVALAERRGTMQPAGS